MPILSVVSFRRLSANSAARTKASSAPANTRVCAASMRSARGTLASPKCPRLKVVDQTTASVTTKAAAAANSGRQRTATHNRRGNTRATGKAVAHGPCGREMTNTLSTARVTSPTVPSISSRRGGSSRTASANPISSGATVTMPSEHDANQRRHTVGADAVGWTRLTATAAPTAAIAAPTAVATRNPSTWDTSSSLNALPNQRSISHAVRRAWPALTRPKAMASPGVPGNHEVGEGGCDCHGGSHRQAHARPERYQHAHGNARRRPKDGHTFPGAKG